MRRTDRDKAERFEFAMPDAMRAALSKLSSETKMSIQFLVRRIVGDYLVAQGYMPDNEPFGNRSTSRRRRRPKKASV